MNLLIFPNQLFKDHPGFKLKPSRVILIEDSLFFGDSNYPLRFHQQKLWLHRATMKRYEQELQQKGWETLYLDYIPEACSLKNQLSQVVRSMKSTPRTLIVADPADFILEKRLHRICNDLEVDLHLVPNPGFLNEPDTNKQYRASKNRWFMADFYKFQRKRLKVLVEGDDPVGGQWSFDKENRKKIPKQMLGRVPSISKLPRDAIDTEAQNYVREKFPHHPGQVDELIYPSSRKHAEKWLREFLQHKFEYFGVYEDAIQEGESWLWHSILTPALNVGLLTPGQVLKKTIKHAAENEVPLNSLEGFVRQIIGWREFIRATYSDHGVEMRTSNHWGHHRAIPKCFYDGTTGILPLDDTIQRVLRTGYCHHIERLMVLGGFMFLCEFEPTAIYRWFMELFIDSYDWVMVPNVYAMSQHADGGLITTKPYFSGSSYIRKMSHHKTAPWCDVWDGLYWRWIWNHIDELARNPRWAMMCSTARKMDRGKMNTHIENANHFMDGLD